MIENLSNCLNFGLKISALKLSNPSTSQNRKSYKKKSSINSFSTNVSLQYPLKTSENRRFYDTFTRYGSGTLVENVLR